MKIKFVEIDINVAKPKDQKSEFDVGNDLFEAVSAVAEKTCFFFCEIGNESAADSVVTDDAECAEGNVIDTVFAVHHRRDRHCCVRTVDEALADVANGKGNCVEGSAFTLNDLRTGLADILLYLSIVDGRQCKPLVVEASVAFLDGNIGDIGKRPGDKGRIAMFAKNVSVAVTLADGVIF